MTYDRAKLDAAIKMVQDRFRKGKTEIPPSQASRFRSAVLLRERGKPRPMQLERCGADIRVFDAKTAYLVPMK